jgi:hypothetical protein
MPPASCFRLSEWHRKLAITQPNSRHPRCGTDGNKTARNASLFACVRLRSTVRVCAGVGTLVHFLAHLHSTCGPLATEATEGSSQVLARTAAQLAMQVRCQCTPNTACCAPQWLGLCAQHWETVAAGKTWAKFGQPQKGKHVDSAASQSSDDLSFEVQCDSVQVGS